MITDTLQTRSRALRKALVLALALPLALPMAGALPAMAQDGGSPPAVTGERGQDASKREARMDRGHMDRGMDRDRRGYRHDRDGDGDRDRDRGHRWHHQWSGERLATRLAAAEVAAGIKTAQLDAWRSFTAALVDFATPMPHRGRPGGPGTMDDDAAGGPGEGMPMEGQMDDMSAGDVPAGQQAAPGDAAGAQPPASGAQPPASGTAEQVTRPDGPRLGRGRPSGFDFLDRVILRVEDRAAKAERLKTAKSALEAVLEPGQREIIERYLTPKRGHGKRR